VFGFFIGILLFSTLALLPPMMQEYMGYSAFQSGLATMPRGLGTFVGMLFVGQLIGKIDTRLILFTGLTLSTMALWQMSHFDLSMNVTPIVVSGIIQGFGIGLIFIPLSAIAYSTLASALRPDATGVYNLVRNMGSSVGISLMEALWTSNSAIEHATLAAHIQPGNPVVSAGLPQMFNPSTAFGLQALNGEINNQAAMVAYIDDFRLMMLVTIGCMPLLLFMRPPRTAGRDITHAVAD
jgi:DHA2 family multidrug resistance protein